MYSNCEVHSCLFNILSLMKQPIIPASKKILPKFPNILERICAWFHNNEPAKSLKMTLLERFFKNSANNITIYSIHYKQFNLAGCFSHKYFRILNHRCSNTLVLSISQMKSLKGTKKLELNLNVEFGRVVLSKSFISRGMHARKWGTKIIPFCLVIPSRLKKSRFLSRPASIINSPLNCCSCKQSCYSTVLF